MDLEKHLRFYGAYHHDPVNKGIHIFFVPILLYTGLMLAQNTPEIPLPDYLQIPHYPLNLGNIGCLIYVVLYVLLEPVAGSAFALLVFLGNLSSAWVRHQYGTNATQVATVVHISSWIAQFIGHGKFEGRAPALLDNIFQAVFLAPLFVWLEVCFSFGYRPELHARIEQGVEADVAKYTESKAVKANGSANGHANGHAKST